MQGRFQHTPWSLVFNSQHSISQVVPTQTHNVCTLAVNIHVAYMVLPGLLIKLMCYCATALTHEYRRKVHWSLLRHLTCNLTFKDTTQIHKVHSRQCKTSAPVHMHCVVSLHVSLIQYAHQMTLTNRALSGKQGCPVLAHLVCCSLIGAEACLLPAVLGLAVLGRVLLVCRLRGCSCRSKTSSSSPSSDDTSPCCRSQAAHVCCVSLCYSNQQWSQMVRQVANCFL